MVVAFKCRHCGLPVTISEGRLLRYDADEWQQRCAHPDLKSPALCIAEHDREGANKPKKTRSDAQ